MRKIIILLYVLINCCNLFGQQNICNDNVFYTEDENDVELKYTFFYFEKYLHKSGEQRVEYFQNLITNPPDIYLRYGQPEKDVILIKKYFDDFLGDLIINDLESKTHISIDNVIESKYPGLYISDSVGFSICMFNCKEQLKKKLFLKIQKEFVGGEKYKKYEYYPSLLFPYFHNSIENRILFLEKYYSKMDMKILQLIRLDLDTTLGSETYEYKHRKKNRKIVKKNIIIWQKKIEEIISVK